MRVLATHCKHFAVNSYVLLLFWMMQRDLGTLMKLARRARRINNSAFTQSRAMRLELRAILLPRNTHIGRWPDENNFKCGLKIKLSSLHR